MSYHYITTVPHATEAQQH